MVQITMLDDNGDEEILEPQSSEEESWGAAWPGDHPDSWLEMVHIKPDECCDMLLLIGVKFPIMQPELRI